ncbi:MAG: hypothetical protein JOZ77_03260 [Candidatus Eremiobacteraeota bacterium]|nr:hypothetical protein [Candidatus Eremiobacteraeota bacterium]
MIQLLALILAANVGASQPKAILPLRPYLKQQETIDATIDGVHGTFLFDTGEGVSAIGSDFARRIKCRPWGRITGFRMSGERAGYPHCDNLVLAANGITVSLPSAITLDVGDLIGANAPHIDGAIGLDAFAGLAITIVPRGCIIVESRDSLAQRIISAQPLPIRIVRDAEGVALSVDGAVPTPDGIAWMELDSGNGGSLVVGDHIAPLLGLKTDVASPEPYSFKLANGIVVSGPTRTRDLIMDGDIGARFLNDWNLTLDLAAGRAWLAPRGGCLVGFTKRRESSRTVISSATSSNVEP